MSSPQENYSYQELQHYLGVAETALSNYRNRYPNLQIETWQPEQLVVTDLQESLNVLRKRIADMNAYLEYDEIEGVEIGSHVHNQDSVKRKKLEKRIGKAEWRFRKDLHDLTTVYEIQLKGLYMQLSQMSAKFTAGRIQELHRLEKWVETQRHYSELYHINQCRRYSAMKDLGLYFADEAFAAPTKSGVYVLFKDGDIIYVGSSQNLRSRLANHEVVRNSYCKDGVEQYKIECVYTELPIGQARGVEQKMIRLAAPELNKKGRAT